MCCKCPAQGRKQRETGMYSARRGARHLTGLAHLIVTTVLQSECLQPLRKCYFLFPRRVHLPVSAPAFSSPPPLSSPCRF